MPQINIIPSLLRNTWLIYPIFLFGLPNSIRPASIPVAPESLLMLFLIFCCGLGDLAITKGRRLVDTFRSIPAIAYFLFLIIGVAWIMGPSEQKEENLLRLFLWMVTFIFAFFSARNYGSRHFFNVWIFLAIGGALYLISSPEKWDEIAFNIMAWEHRTGFGYFLVVPSLLLIKRVFFFKKLRSILIDSAILSPLLIAIIITYSRGPWLLLYIGTLLIIVAKKRKLHLIIFFTATIIFIVTFLVRSDTDIALRFRSIYDFNIASSSFYRMDLLLAAFKAIPEIGFIGLGPNEAGNIIYKYTIQKYSHMYTSDHLTTDSDVVRLLVEAGPIAIVLLFFLIFLWGKRLVRNFSNINAFTDQLISNVSLYVVFIGFIFFDDVLSSPLGWFLLGIGCGSMSASTNEASRSKPQSMPYGSRV